MKQFYLLVSFILVLNSHQATAQNDSIYFWKGGVLDLKKSIKTADLDSITFRRVVPATPENLTGEAISTTELLLMWTDRSTNESGFKIERKLVSGSFVVIGTTDTNIFTFNDKGLIPNTSYIYRVYSYNAAGKSTLFTNELTLTTKALLPSLTTSTIASITTTTAISGGTITADGGSTISARGIVWSTSSNPTINLSTKTSDGSGTGSFSSSIIGLNASTTYFVRAYATNSGGTGYGSEVSFTTATADIITIGSQTWTTKNLDVATYSDGTVIPQVTDPTAWAALTTGAWCYYNNDSANGTTYGKLYNWYAVAGIWNEASKTDASQRKKLAPTGYHVPTDAEWTTLTDYLGGQAGGKMKAIGSSDWWLKDVTNSSGFTGLLGGYRIWWGSSFDIGSYGEWWSSSEIDATTAWYRHLYSFNNSAGRFGNDKKFGVSVRCLRDTAPTVGSIATTAVSTIASTTARTGATITSDGGAAITERGVVWSTLSAPTIALSTKTTDGSGTESFSSLMTGLSPQTKYYVRAYATNSFGTAYGNEVNFITLTSTSRPGEVAVGTQSWTTKNLDVATYSDGTAIPEVKDPTQWNNLTTGAWCYLENDPANGTTYGKLYNLYAVLGIWNEASKTDNTERKKLAPIGYHMPSNDEWITLTSFLGGDAIAGVKMKATTSWGTYGDATNSSGFTGLQGGSRNHDGTFAGYSTQWWSNTEKDNAYGGIYLSSYSGGVSSPSTGSCRKNGLSVRCLRDNDVAPSPGPVPEFGSLTTSEIATSVTTAKSGATITSDGGATITDRGIVWSTSSSPTIFSCTKTKDGSGIGSFNSLMTDLSPGTTYYVRAYATNNRGTAYGAEVIFTTLKTYTIGLWPDLGGYVFSLDNDGLHGLVAETIDQSSGSSWYNAPNIISNPATHSLDGKIFTNWRLPTIDELNQMYNVRDTIGNFSGSFYWSSTLNNKYDWYAWNIDFRDGTRRYGSKDSNSFAVRAVRNF